MKRVLAAGVILLAVAVCPHASAQPNPAPPNNSQAEPQAKPKSNKKTGVTKTATTAPPKAANKRTPPKKDAAAYYEIGMSHYQSKRFKDAIEAFQQSIRLGSVEPKTYYNLGRAYYSLHRYIEAREAYKKTVRARPEWADAHYQLGWMYHILADKEAAQAQYKILQRLDASMAQKFKKLLDENDLTASETNGTASGNNAAGAKASAPTANPTNANSSNATPDKKPAVPPTANTSTPAVSAPDRTSQPVVPTETSGNTNGSGGTPSNGAGGNAASTGASAAVTSPAKDETAANDPAAETVASSGEMPLTNIYRVSVGDVLDVRVLNTPTTRSTLYTALSGGLIEFPLTGGTFPVAGFMTDEIGARLSAELKRRGLGDSAQVVVSVRDYTSHVVFVSGLVNYPGKKILSREAVPLYVLIAEAQLRPDAGRAVIMRGAEAIAVNDLNDPTALNVLVKPADVITISARLPQYYFIGGRVDAPGQKNYQPGLTLIQAIIAAGGLPRSDWKAEISREEADGHLTTTKYSLKEIKSGKIPDPHIQPGDRIEVKR